MEVAIDSLVRSAGNLSAGQVDADTLNKWLSGLESEQRSSATIRSYRADLLAVLRLGCDMGWCSEPISRRIRKPKLPNPLPCAWSFEDFSRLLRTAENLPGEFRGMPACAYWTCLFRIAYESGLRRGNLFRLRQGNVRDDGTLYVRHEKTGQPHTCTLDPGTIRLLRKLPGDMPLHTSNCGYYYRALKKICKLAGISPGGLQKIRKTAATLVWLEDEDNPSRVQRFLGHLTPDMWRHYVDTSQGVKRPPRPPRV